MIGQQSLEMVRFVVIVKNQIGPSNTFIEAD